MTTGRWVGATRKTTRDTDTGVRQMDNDENGVSG